MDNYNKYKDTFQDAIIRQFGVDRETNVPKLCDELDCRECSFSEGGCTIQMKEWLNQDDDKYITSLFMKRFTKII